MLLITIFVELRVVAGRSRKRAGSPQAVSRRPLCTVVLRRTAWSEHGMGAAWAWHGKCETDTAALCKSNAKDTFYTLSGTAWHGNDMGAAWTRHGHRMDTACYVCIGIKLTQCIYVFCMDLIARSLYYHIQSLLLPSYKLESVCVMCGVN
jgi:hypothetical protein